MSHPAYGAWDRARHSAPNDRAIVARYESYTDDHRALQADLRARTDAGLGTDPDAAFLSRYDGHVAEREAASQ